MVVMDMMVMHFAMAILALANMARGRGLLMFMLPSVMLWLTLRLTLRLMLRLTLSQRLMLVCTMEDMAMGLVLEMLDLDMLDMVVMDLAMVLDMDVSSMVKQFIHESKSSKVTF